MTTHDEWRECAVRIAWSVGVGIAAAFLLLPLFARFARAEGLDAVDAGAVGLDLMGLATATVIVTLAVEVVRRSVPWLSRTHDLSEGAKVVLRLLSIGLGLGAGLLEWAPAIGDGSNPTVFGGVGAGLLASVFGAQVMGALQRRVRALTGPDEASS